MIGVMPAAIPAGLFYALLLFGLGVLLGPLREFVFAPRFGALGAVLVEAVPMIAAMAWLAPRIARGMKLPPRSSARLVMGAVALLLVLLAELALARQLRGLGPAGWLAHYATPEGIAGAALLLVFAAMPWLRR